MISVDAMFKDNDFCGRHVQKVKGVQIILQRHFTNIDIIYHVIIYFVMLRFNVSLQMPLVVMKPYCHHCYKGQDFIT